MICGQHGAAPTAWRRSLEGTEALRFVGPSVLDSPTAPQYVIAICSTRLNQTATNQQYLQEVQPVTGGIDAVCTCHAEFTVMWTESVPISDLGNRVSPTLFRLLMAALLIVAGRPPVNVPAPIFSIYPAPLDFGSQSVGNSTPLQVTVTNTRPGALGIVSITATGDYSVTDTCVSASPIAVNATCTIMVSFAPTATGAREGSVAIANSVTILPVAFVVTGLGVTP